jgi:hypothetical protein
MKLGGCDASTKVVRDKLFVNCVDFGFGFLLCCVVLARRMSLELVLERGGKICLEVWLFYKVLSK